MREDRLLNRVLHGKYRLESQLASGGQSVVYLGRHIYLDMEVAVKVLPLKPSEDSLRRFYREGKLASQLSHPHNTKVHDLGHTEDGVIYMVLELVEGRQLSELPKPMHERRAIRLAQQVCGALTEAHRLGIVHRDLKPANIMVSQVDGQDFVRVLDYGLAKPINDPDPLTAEGVAGLGTPRYMSPEQAAGLPVDPRSDLYSLGVLLYELVVGRPPFTSKSHVALITAHMAKTPTRPRLLADITEGLDALLMQCLEKDPQARPSKAVELREKLEALV